MKITIRQIRRIIRESVSEDAYRAGYEDARQGRPFDNNSQMRRLDPRQYDYGFDRGSADNASDRRRPDEYDARISEAMGSDADALQRIRNREKMIGRGIDGGTIGYDPNYDYDKRPKSTRNRGGFGHLRQIKPFFDDHGFKFKSKSSHDGVASLPTDASGSYGYFVKITFDGAKYKMSWLKREKAKDDRGRIRVKVTKNPDNWEVDPVEKDLRTAIDEIAYYIAEDEAKGFE